MRYALLVSLLLISLPISASSYHGDEYVILTGFEPFGNYEINPSQMVVEELNGSTVGNAKIISFILPVDFNKSAEIIKRAIEDYNPAVVICTGLDGSARKIEVEKIALNIRWASLDNKFGGWKKMENDAPFFLLSTLPVEEIVEAIDENGIEARISYFAGTYSCNYVFYSTLLYMEEDGKDIPVGFIHLPPLKSQKRYGMELEDMKEAIKIAIERTLASA